MDEFQGVAGRRNRMLALPRVSFKVRMWGSPPLYDLEKKKLFFSLLICVTSSLSKAVFFTFFFSFFGLIN
jgi:hypothetical protein